MQLFFSENIENKVFTLGESESTHIIRVLRHKKGDDILITDGKGGIYQAIITDDNPKSCKASVTGRHSSVVKHPYYLHLAIAPTKSIDRFEWFVEKAIEFGIDEISPIICDHSERRKINTDRLNKIAISAMKQSLKTYRPKINEMIYVDSFLESGFEGKKLIAHIHDKVNTSSLAKVCRKRDDSLVLIGPEGGFSNREVNMAIAKEYIPVHLGKSRLRTETAGIAACCMICFINQ